MKDIAIVIDSESKIRKPKSLIFAKVKENLPISANRLWYAVLAEIAKRPENDNGTSFVINGKDIAELANLPANVVGQQLEEIYKNSSKLAGYTIEIVESDGNPMTVSMISSAKYFKNSRAIRVNIDPNLLPYLKNYVGQISVSYALGGPMKFKCVYSAPLYDLMNFYLGQREIQFTIEEMRDLLHVPEGKLTTVTNLNARAVYPAVKEIVSNTNLNVECELIKEGRVAKGYKFVIEEKDENFLDIEDPEERKVFNFIQKIISPPFNVNKDLVFQLMQTYGIDSCIVNFEYTKKQKYESFIRYYRYCLKNKIGEKELEKAQLREADYAKYSNISPLADEHSEDAAKSLPPIEDIKPLTEEERVANDERMKKENPQMYRLKQLFDQKLAKRKTEN